MNPKPIVFNLHYQSQIRKIEVTPSYKKEFCTYSVVDAEGYLFTLVPTDNPFTDFTISKRDEYLNHSIEWPLLDKVKNAIINHFM
jgi:hypothetical protein